MNLLRRTIRAAGHVIAPLNSYNSIIIYVVLGEKQIPFKPCPDDNLRHWFAEKILKFRSSRT